MKLSLYSDDECGGQQIFIIILDNTKEYEVVNSCTTEQYDIKRGETKVWNGEKLGECTNTFFNFSSATKIEFRLRTRRLNSFCPLYLTMKIDNAVFESKILEKKLVNKNMKYKYIAYKTGNADLGRHLAIEPHGI